MKQKSRIACVIVLLITLSIACSLLPGSNTGSGNTAADAAEYQVPAQDFSPGLEDAVWPDYIPEDIPVPEGEISTVMTAPGSHVRIFYHSITEDQIRAYLETLEAQGFLLEYLVYSEPGFESSAEERAAAGEYDAVDITGGGYHMRLGYGADTAVYDIYIQGFSLPEPQGPQWPADLAGRLPQPEECPLLGVDQTGEGEYRIRCNPELEDTAQGYILTLQQNGFVPADCSPIVYEAGDPVTLEGQGLCITVVAGFQQELLLEIRPGQPSLEEMWPEELNGLVPVPEGGSVLSVLDAGEHSYLIPVTSISETWLQEYLARLESAGFQELDRWEDMNGELITLTLAGNGWVIEISPSTLNGLEVALRIYQE